ncbi:MAG: hypothetical protein ABSG68_26980 [Thermoguttaceae bacterium]|jgi:hypothetical protein
MRKATAAKLLATIDKTLAKGKQYYRTAGELKQQLVAAVLDSPKGRLDLPNGKAVTLRDPFVGPNGEPKMVWKQAGFDRWELQVIDAPAGTNP